MKIALRSLFLAGFISVCVPAHAIQQQEQSNWCWAASVQDLLAQVGTHVSQTQLVIRLLGVPANNPANVDQLAALLKSYGRSAWTVGAPGSPTDIYNTMVLGYRLIAFVKPFSGPVGHFIVIQNFDPMNGAVLVSDPHTGMSNWQPLAALYASWHWGASVVVG